jgi:Zn-dependent peptidase ImmA (M78 family)
MKKHELISQWHLFNLVVFNSKLNYERINFTKNDKFYGYYKNGIMINKNMSKFEIDSTLAHEMCHQAQEQLLKLKHEKNDFHGETFKYFSTQFLIHFPELEL